MRNGFGSFWLHDTPDPGSPRRRLEGDISADLAVVGAGLTGLWTAYWHAIHNPGERVVVLEKDRVGYGASGRNGGWLSGKTVGVRENLMKSGHTPAEALAMERRLFRAVDDVTEILEGAALDVDAVKGGWMQIARTESGLARIRAYVEKERQWGLSPDDVVELSEAQVQERVNIAGLKGAAYSPHAVRLNPAKLVYAVAQLCEQAGVSIFEGSEVTELTRDRLRTAHGSVDAGMRVLATEGYTPALRGRKREILPMLSSMIITEPLPEEALNRIGWSGSELISCAEHTYFYAQRTADDRIAIGGRGRPYNWGSALDSDGRLDEGTVRQLRGTLQSLFPQVRFSIAHAWCGVLGVSRDWSPFIDLQSENRLLQLGGYTGQGVTATYLAGRTAAELLAGHDTELTRSTWVRRLPRKWEPEPLRWLGANSVYRLYQLADAAESRRGGAETSLFARMGNRISGR